MSGIESGQESPEKKIEDEREQMKAWDELWKKLEASNPKELAKTFAMIQSMGNELAGFVIEGIDTKTNAVKYLSDNETWEEFGDVGRREDPKIYKTLAAFNKARKKWEDRITQAKTDSYSMYVSDRNIEPGIKLWQHPDSHIKPLDKFLEMTGEQFPGSPRQ